MGRRGRRPLKAIQWLQASYNVDPLPDLGDVVLMWGELLKANVIAFFAQQSLNLIPRLPIFVFLKVGNILKDEEAWFVKADDSQHILVQATKLSVSKTLLVTSL